MYLKDISLERVLSDELSKFVDLKFIPFARLKEIIIRKKKFPEVMEKIIALLEEARDSELQQVSMRDSLEDRKIIEEQNALHQLFDLRVMETKELYWKAFHHALIYQISSATPEGKALRKIYGIRGEYDWQHQQSSTFKMKVRELNVRQERLISNMESIDGGHDYFHDSSIKYRLWCKKKDIINNRINENKRLKANQDIPADDTSNIPFIIAVCSGIAAVAMIIAMPIVGILVLSSTLLTFFALGGPIIFALGCLPLLISESIQIKNKNNFIAITKYYEQLIKADEELLNNLDSEYIDIVQEEFSNLGTQMKLVKLAKKETNNMLLQSKENEQRLLTKANAIEPSYPTQKKPSFFNNNPNPTPENNPPIPPKTLYQKT